MKSKTLIGKQVTKKTNPELVETILLAKKKAKWVEIAGILSSPRANMMNLNLDKLNEESKEGETVVVPGKILAQGELNKKIKVVALSFSEKAKEKILKSKGEISTILEEIKKNPDAKNIKFITEKK